MTTFTPNQSTIDERIREAWTAYSVELADLEGRAYDAAEEESWERLQDTLRAIEADRPPTQAPGATA